MSGQPMSPTVTVPLVLPRKVWGRLASFADNRGVKVADLIADAIEGIIPPPPTVTQLQILERELQAARRNGFRYPRREAS